MKQHIETIKDSFVDFAGKEHIFVMAAVSEELHCMTALLDDGSSQNIPKKVGIGVSICNPDDEFNEKIGIAKAVSRAKKSRYVLFVTDAGLINTTVVQALLKQESEYLKNNPDKYIRGYNEAKTRFEKRREIERLANNFTDIEQSFISYLKDNPKSIDNIKCYLKWIENKNDNK